MSNISEIRVHLSSDDRELLEAAGENETNFVRGAVTSALKELEDEQKELADDEPVEPEPEPEEETESEEESSEDGEE